MKRPAIQLLAILLFSCCLFARAAFVDVPQASSNDYIFTKLAAPALIRGKIIDPDSPHGPIRYEDVAWLQEAAAERAAILAGTMPQTGSNVQGRVNERVSQTDYRVAPAVTESQRGWLDCGAPILSGTRVRLGLDRATTNVYWQTVYTNAYTNAASVISVTLTNGIVTAFTNRWQVGYAGPSLFLSDFILPAKAPVTNIHEWTTLDFCHALDAPFPLYTNKPSRVWGDPPFTWTLWPSARAVAHDLAMLRGTSRLADINMSYTNRFPIVTVTDWDGGPHYTISSTAIRPRFEESNHASRGSMTEFGSGAYVHLDVPTRFDSALVVTGGVVRVAVEAAFARFQVSMTHLQSTNIVERLSTYGVIRVDDGTLDLSGDRAYCGVDVSPVGICALACADANVTLPFLSAEARAPEDESYDWACYVDSITLLYTITPSTKLPEW